MKPLRGIADVRICVVAPRAGAWIETLRINHMNS